ncbi:hypothetical protein [Yoonia sediminilitoris]|uniref:Uncharacterized protein n=1 Tax=Yoonia sediminilitoris TaxID=1286148 RepID=A0A2T6K9E0_9RHOB|nr:hypothetical protein [Yoonia sediminilitoris]PUB11326.1 hypothetical protein C8N45_114101 [Yoonia sediminilitoris]RCW91143.1 hypothetical protein DFP92_114102 [Yoonia sediminilitoris]
MKSPNIEGARAYAKDFLVHLSPRFDELLTKNGGHWYRRDMIQLKLGIEMINGAYEVPFIPASLLMRLAEQDKAAFDLMLHIMETNREANVPLPIGWEEWLTRADKYQVPVPNMRGKNGNENGVRDLIFRVMAATITGKYGLYLSKNDQPTPSRSNSATIATACEIIAEAFREAGLTVPSNKSIEKAIRRCEDIDLFEGHDD